jgi:chemotaxis protein MotB
MKNINNTSTSIKNWSKDDQPYEKIKNYGPTQLSNSELLAILIKNGNKNNSAIDLAKAIENDTEMEVIVEGHTDTDKLNSPSYPKDNWDLSVLRATEVVKIMLSSSSVKPQILSAAGRGEFFPVDASDKSKNRRIEIILQPKLDELYKLIEGQ